MNNIIFIDDEINILESYKSIFKKNKPASKLLGLADEFLGESSSKAFDPFDEVDFNILTADQGLVGVELVKKMAEQGNPLKVAFIDMRMPPGINGLETAKMIRGIDSKIEIVLVTAYSDVDFKTISQEIGAHDKLLYLKKPFDTQEIKQIALNLIVKHRNETIKDDFISNVSHELKTPLSSIIGFYDLLREKSDTLNDKELSEYVNYIGMSAQIMKSLVEELLTSVEMKRSGVFLDKQPVEMIDFVNSCYKSLKPIFKDNENVTFSFINECTDEVPISMIDSLKIRQCINNLVNNSYKFTEKGFVELKIYQECEWVIVAVTDSGIGIPHDKFKNIFEKFFRVENEHHQIPGLGLGLSILKKIMDSHEALVCVSSVEGEGSCFELKFQLKR